jgi:hypothetical protein
MGASAKELSFRAGPLNPKAETGDKPQIAQISQMTEAKEFSADSGRNSTGTKKLMVVNPWFFLL